MKNMEMENIKPFEKIKENNEDNEEKMSKVREILEKSPFWETLSKEEQDELIKKYIHEKKEGNETVK